MRYLVLAILLVTLTGCHPHWLLGVCEPVVRDRGWVDAPVTVFQLDTASGTVKAWTQYEKRRWIDTVCVPH